MCVGAAAQTPKRSHAASMIGVTEGACVIFDSGGHRQLETVTFCVYMSGADDDIAAP